MKGKNSLMLNQATMVEALQLWLDKQMVQEGQIKVTSVAFVNNDDQFEVVIEDNSDGV